MKETKSPFAFFSTLRSLWFLVGALFLPISGWAAPIGDLGTVPSTSEFPTVYTAGDPTPIVAGLNAVAMLFGHGHVSDSVVGGGMAVMVLVSFAIFLIASIIKEKLLVAPWLINLLVMILLFYPTTSVRVVSYFDANGSSSTAPQYVDNIPLGVGYALGIAGAIDYRVTTGIETAFSLVSSEGNFMQLGTDGFAKPLKILLAMRTMYDCNVHQTTCQNLLHFMHYCKFGGANHSSTMDMSQLDTPPTVADTGVVGLLNSQRKSYTLYFDPTSAIPTEPKLVPCGVAADGIIAQMKNYVQNNPVNEMFSAQPVTMAHDMATVTAQTDSATDTPNSTYTGANSAYDTYAQLIQNVTAQTGGDANTFMINQVFSPTVLAAIRADANPNAAVAFQQIMGEAYERARVSMAASGSMFVNFMTASMNLFTFMFGAFAPIVALIGAAAGMSALRLYGSYFIFGVWTQTWMPVASIISYYTQVAFNSLITGSRIKAMAFAPSQIDHLYDNVGNMLATAGTMMAATPLITLSLLTGSVFALTSLANRSSGSGEQYVDSNRLSPTVDKASNAGAIEDSYKSRTGQGWFALGGSRSGGAIGDIASGGSGSKPMMTEAEASGMGSVSTNTSWGTGIEQRASAQATFQKSLAAATERASSFARTYGTGAATSLASSMDHGWNVGEDGKQAVSSRISEGIKGADTSAEKTDTSASASLGGGAKGGGGTGILGGMFSTGVGARVGQSQGHSTDVTSDLATGQQFEHGSHAGTSSSGKESSQSTQTSDTGMKEAAQETARAIKQAQEAYQQLQAVSSTASSADRISGESTVSLGSLAWRAQQSQAVGQASLAGARNAAQTVASMATGQDPGKTAALKAKAFQGVDPSVYNPSNARQLMRNVADMVQSNDVAEQAVGYAIAGAVAKATDYPGEGAAITRNAYSLASAARDIESTKSSMTPGLSPQQSAKTSELSVSSPAEIRSSASGLGADVDHLAPTASHITEGSVSGHGAAVHHNGSSIAKNAAASEEGVKNVQKGIERSELMADIKARDKLTHGSDSALSHAASLPSGSDVEKAAGEVMDKTSKGGFSPEQLP